MKLSYILLFLSVLSNSLRASQEQFIIRQLNYFDQQEVKQVCDIFKDEEIQERAHATPNVINYEIQNTRVVQLTKYKDHPSVWNFIICQTSSNPSQVCGMLAFSKREDTARLMALAVKNEFRRQGIASALLSDFEQNQISSSVNCLYVNPECRIYDNEQAIACLRKNGFQRSFFDFFGMEKNLHLKNK